MKNKVACNIRIEEETWLKLKEVAKVNKRSINKEIEYLIEMQIKRFELDNGKINIEDLYE